MEKKAAIKDIVANVDIVEKLTKNETLVERYTNLVALAKQDRRVHFLQAFFNDADFVSVRL